MKTWSNTSNYSTINNGISNHKQMHSTIERIGLRMKLVQKVSVCFTQGDETKEIAH